MPPLYDYACDTCGHTQEVSHKMTETPKIECEKCGSVMRKLISAAGFNLKGPGWYKSGFSGKK